jgi:hypothetical protein
VVATPAAGVQGIKRNEKLRQNTYATILHCNHCHLANLPIALKLFDMKWKRSGRTMFMTDAFVHVMSVLVQVMLQTGRHSVGWMGGGEAEDEDPVGSHAQVVKWLTKAKKGIKKSLPGRLRKKLARESTASG